MIPDIKIHNIIKSCLVAIRSDYEINKATPSNTILWYLLNSSVMEDTGKYNWFTQGVEIFINRNENHTKLLDTRLFFDRERALIPTIHVMLSGETKGKDGIGVDIGFHQEVVVGDTVREVFNRQFDINANIVITSDTTFETLIIYHVIKSMLICLMTHIQLLGFINPMIGGKDLALSQEVVPNGVYARVLNFSAGYELSVPESQFRQIINTVWVQMKKIDDNAIPNTGPGPFNSSTQIQTEGNQLPS